MTTPTFRALDDRTIAIHAPGATAGYTPYYTLFFDKEQTLALSPVDTGTEPDVYLLDTVSDIITLTEYDADSTDPQDSQTPRITYASSTKVPAAQIQDDLTQLVKAAFARINAAPAADHQLTDEQYQRLVDEHPRQRELVEAAFKAGREHERTHADDGWEPLGETELRIGDEARIVHEGITQSGIVAGFNANGNPQTASGICIGDLQMGQWSVHRAPARYHRLSSQDPAHITGVKGTDRKGGDFTCDYMALEFSGGWVGVDHNGLTQHVYAEQINDCTLEDGKVLTRDGTFGDDTPRFREVLKPEKED